MDFYLAFLIVITVVNLALGLMVWCRDRKNIVNKSFGLTIVSATCWSIFNYLCDLQSQAPNALLWNKLTLIFGIIFASLFAYFGLVFPQKKKFSRFLNPPFSIIIFSFVVFLSYLILFTTFILKKIEFYEWGTNIIKGELFFLLSTYCIGCVTVGLWSLISKYKESKGVEKKQLQFLLLGIMLSAVGILTTNLIQPLITGTNPYAKYGPYFITFLIIFTTYSITKHHLMDLKIVTTELLVGLVLIILLIDVLLSKTISVILFKLVILITFTYVGISLIRSVLQEIKRREEVEKMSWKLQRAYQELKKLDIAKSEFIAMASHQLRTPLTIIKGLVSMLAAGSYGGPPPEFKRPLKNIFDSNERLIKIVNDLLNISKIELGKMEISKEKTRIEDLIEGVLQEFKMEADKKRLYLKWERPKEPLPEMNLDVLKIRQVIACMIDNAIRYTQRGGARIECKLQNSKCKILVEDTGMGMTKKEIQKLFTSFARGRAGISLFVQGTGLGLYLAKRYIELHKGRIWVESRGKNKGSTFYIELPIKQTK